MTPLEILKAARAKIDTPEKWIQGDYAKDAGGRAVPENDLDAVCFCVIGSFWAVAGYGAPDSVRSARSKAIDMLRSIVGNIPTFNDSSTHEQVMEAFDAAIANG